MLATPSLSPADPAVYGWLAGVACACLIIGLLLALWIDHHVVGHLHGLLLACARTGSRSCGGCPPGPAGANSPSWAMRSRTRSRGASARRAQLADLDRVREQLRILFASIEYWQRTERWERPALPEGEVSAVGELLAHALQRRAAVDEQNREAARQVANELAAVIAEAREAATQAERGFVEATALQTTVRELHRLSGELSASLRGPQPAAAAPEPAAASASRQLRVRELLEELVAASFASVESLGRGLARVEDVSDQVQRLANRATLIAIQALAGTRDPATFGDELKTLARGGARRDRPHAAFRARDRDGGGRGRCAHARGARARARPARSRCRGGDGGTRRAGARTGDGPRCAPAARARARDGPGREHQGRAGLDR
jgi:hypothetical protein